MTTGVSLVSGVSGAGLALQPPFDNSNDAATTSFVNQQINRSIATLPLALGSTGGGLYNQASLGSGAQVVVFVSSSPGPVTSILSIVNGGTGYAVGDLLILPSGGYDCILRVTNVTAGVIQSGGLQLLYGGTNYTTSSQSATLDIPPSGRTVILSGTLTSNATIYITSGTYATASRRSIYCNNTTGSFTVTVQLSNGAGGGTGASVVLTQGTANSTAMWVWTDGVNGVWTVAA